MNTRHSVIDSTLGELTVVAGGSALTGVYFRHHWHRPDQATFGDRIDAQSDEVLAEASKQLTDYLAGDRTDFDLPVSPQGDERQQRVWKMVTAIPFGGTVTYGELATALADGTTAQQLGQAVGRNPLCIVIPCHRVVGRQGQLTGYAGGLKRKQWLLGLEEPVGVKAARFVLMPETHWRKRVESGSWDAITAELNDFGGATLPRLLTDDEAAVIRRLYPDDDMFRSTVDMRRYRFGEGEYRYFHQPYPEPIEALKQALYPRLLPIARDWWAKLGRESPWPDTLDDWLDMCHTAGQRKSTAILLKYGAGDWNALHRDLYGELVFPLQVVINLSEPNVNHTGGEFLLVEQRPRAQSRGTSTLLPRGHGFVFTTRERPVRSVRGWSASPVRHGVSVVRSGERFTLGLVFHDAA